MVILQRKTVQFLIALVLALGLVGCPSEDWRERAAIYMRDFAVSLEAVQTAEIEAHRAGYVGGVDHIAFQSYVVTIATYGKAANTALGQGSKRDALAQIDLALAELDNLQKQGLLGVKNENSKAAISALVLAVRSVLVGAKVQLQ